MKLLLRMLVWVGIVVFPEVVFGAGFRAGVAAVDVTPKTFPRRVAGGFLEGRADRVSDPLFVRSFVIDDGTTKIALAIVDTCMMEQSLIDAAKVAASAKCGIPVERMMVSATHTHSAPAAMGCLGTRKDEEYARILGPKIAEAIVAADAALQPARIGWGRIDDWEHTYNRRWIRLPGKEVGDPFGGATGRAHMHPGYLSKDVVGPSGPVDPQLSVISLQTIDGEPLGVLANYSQHYFGSPAVSADYYGRFCRHLAAKLEQEGGGTETFVCAMSQGTSGDLMWMDYGAGRKSIGVDAYAAEVADSAMRALEAVTYHDHVPLGMIEETLEFGYRVPDEERRAWAKPIAAGIENDLAKNREEVYAREALILHERQKVAVKLQAIRIGELSIATLPNEVYAITGLKLRESSPMAMHFNIELANGATGYIPPPEQHGLGGYTTWPARTAGLAVGTEPAMVAALSESIAELAGRPSRAMRPGDSAYAGEVIATEPVAYFRCDDVESGLSNELGDEAKLIGGHAFYLPGAGSGLGYGEEPALRASAFSGPGTINRSIHLAGGHVEVSDLVPGDRASVGLWCWLGHESGAGDRTGGLIRALGVDLKVRQDARHRVRFELDGVESTEDLVADDWHFVVLVRDGEVVRLHVDGAEEPSLTGKAGKAGDGVVIGRGLEGRVDEIAIWERELAAAAIGKLWEVSKVAGDHARRRVFREENLQRADVETSALLKQHEDWSVSMRFRNRKANDAGAVTAYLISRGPEGDARAPGDHLGIGGSYRDVLPGRLFVFNGNAAGRVVLGKTVVDPGSWNDVKLERRGSRVKVFLNGEVEIDAELPVTAPGVKGLFFGRRCDGFAPLEGQFEKVVVDGLEKPVAAPVPKRKMESQPLSPEASAAKWHVREGYGIELVAAEPVVLDPVAFDWDTEGRLWVVEMADYPLGMDGHGKAGGRVVMLEDGDDDGRYDTRTVIADDLSYPTGILMWRDGAIVTAAPDLIFNGPGGAKKVLFSGFSTGNQQLRVNGLRWGMDGWVYCAAGAHHGGYNKGTQIESKLTGEKIDLGSRDFRFKPDTGELEPQSGPSQFGRTRDDWGHWFGVQNSFPLWHYVLRDHYLRRNLHVIPPNPVQQLFARNPRVYPASRAEKRFHSFNEAGRFTSACGIEVYRDRLLFGDAKTHAFTCEPFHNLVQHHVLEDVGVTFKAGRDEAEATSDFLASEDRWCRPVMVRTGPDGALWVADMYRYMIEHPQWLPKQGQDELLPHYRAGEGLGRIWRVSRSGVGGGGRRGLVSPAAFDTANGWRRDRAQMEGLWGKGVDGAGESIRSGAAPIRAQAAWALLDSGRLEPGQCLALLADESPRVREQALQMVERMVWGGDGVARLQRELAKLVGDVDGKVRLQLACTLGELRGGWVAGLLAELLRDAVAGSVLQGAAMSSVLPHLAAVCALADEKSAGLLFRCALAEDDEEAIAALLVEGAAPAAFLKILDERGLSLADFARQVTLREAREGLEAMRQMLEDAAGVVRSAGGVLPVAELDLLASDRGYREMVKGLLPELWERSGSDDVLRLVARLEPDNGVEFLLAGWEGKTPVVRTRILETLLSRDVWTMELLERPEAKACDAAMRARVVKHPKAEIAALAERVFSGASSVTRAGVLEKFRPALELAGDAAKGAVVFAQACMSCHQLDGIGIDLGPDLRSVVQHDKEKLFNSILDPSAIIEPGFMAYHCTLKSGEQLYGVITTETGSSLTLKLAGNVMKSVLRSDIASLESTGLSLMPEGLEAAMTVESLADLIAYLKRAR